VKALNFAALLALALAMAVGTARLIGSQTGNLFTSTNAAVIGENGRK
jgi:hypothetical protein